MTAVIDASLILRWLQDEPGSNVAERHLMEGIIGAANWSEVLQKARQHGAQPGVVGRLLSSFGVQVAEVTAKTRSEQRTYGIRDQRSRWPLGCASPWACGSALPLPPLIRRGSPSLMVRR